MTSFIIYYWACHIHRTTEWYWLSLRILYWTRPIQGGLEGLANHRVGGLAPSPTWIQWFQGKKKFFQARDIKVIKTKHLAWNLAVQRRNKADSFGDCLSTREPYTLLSIIPLTSSPMPPRGTAHSRVSSVLDKIPLVFAQALTCWFYTSQFTENMWGFKVIFLSAIKEIRLKIVTLPSLTQWVNILFWMTILNIG